MTLKFDAYIGDLKADYVDATVEKNQVLFAVYSPELLAAPQEYLETLKRRPNPGRDNTLLHAARQRLALWDMHARESGRWKNGARRRITLPFTHHAAAR